MIITLKWKDKRYNLGYKYTNEIINDEEWKTFKMILNQKSEKEAKEYLIYQLTTPKKRNKLISIHTHSNQSYWDYYFKEDEK